MTEKMFNAGKIINTHGVKGEVKVLRITDFEERFMPGNHLYLEQDGEQLLKLEIASHRIHKGYDLICFKGYDNINYVEHFKGCYLKITEEQLTELDANEFYYHEIIGCTVFTRAGEKIGVIREILSPGANDVWVVKKEKGKDVLVPYIEDVVKHVDIEAKKVVIQPMEGLLD
ncbi:ribosome maturation factor RimM [Virgibacillus siamensis]|uniref:ribosome maturation factor RimM n=1 Tax=Virgibacillus siamensis TaxID=480071 RepID=UPI000984DF81|nr:ribosome maturation factor RimM [Virgibacillus siamensis]